MQQKHPKDRRLRALSLSVSFVFLYGTMTEQAFAENVNTLTQLEKRIAKLPPASQIKPFVADSTLAPWQARLSTGKTMAPTKSAVIAIAPKPSVTAQPVKIASTVEPQPQSLSAPLPKEFSESFRSAANLPADYLKNNGDSDYTAKLEQYIQYAADHPDVGPTNKIADQTEKLAQMAKAPSPAIADTRNVLFAVQAEEKPQLARTDTSPMDPVDRNRQQPPAEPREVAMDTAITPEKKYTQPFLQLTQSASQAGSNNVIIADAKAQPVAPTLKVAQTQPIAQAQPVTQPVQVVQAQPIVQPKAEPPHTLLSNLPWLTVKQSPQPAPVTLASTGNPIVRSIRVETVQSLGTATVPASPNSSASPKALLELPDPSEAPVAPVNVSDLPPAPGQAAAAPVTPKLNLPVAAATANTTTPAPVVLTPQNIPQPVLKTAVVPATVVPSGTTVVAAPAGPLFIAPLPPSNSTSTQQPSGLSAQDKDILKHLPPEKVSSKSPEPVDIDHARENSVESYADERTHKGVGIQISIKQPKANISRMLENAYNDLLAGDQENAVSLYKQVLEAEPANKLALFGLATTYQRAGQIQLARPLYGKLLAIDPHNVEGLNNFLVLLADEDPKDALTELSKLENSHPGLSMIPAQEAIIYEKSGDYEMAAKKMTIAINLTPENLKYRYDMAVILDKGGNWADAAVLYKQLLTASERGEKIAANPEEIQERLTFIVSNRPKVQPTAYYYGNN